MRLTAQVDWYIRDQQSSGRFNSPWTERGYRDTLMRLADEAGNRDARTLSRDDVKRTLAHWRHPNTQALHRAHLVSFFDWCLEEGIRKDNPARQTRRPRTRKPSVYRLTREEALAVRLAAHPGRERRAIDLGLLAGLRAAELLGLQGRHFRRPGWVWVSADIAKGHKERWVPVLDELTDTWQEIALGCEDDWYVLPRRRVQFGESKQEPTARSSYEPLLKLVKRVGKRAGIAHEVRPHMLRHAFGDHIARHAGMKAAQFVLGHSTVATTETYTGQPTLDEVATALSGFSYSLPPIGSTANPDGEPRASLLRELPGRDEHWLSPEIERYLDPLYGSVLIYEKAFGG